MVVVELEVEKGGKGRYGGEKKEDFFPDRQPRDRRCTAVSAALGEVEMLDFFRNGILFSKLC